jgi:hypothetical protein
VKSGGPRNRRSAADRQDRVRRGRRNEAIEQSRGRRDRGARYSVHAADSGTSHSKRFGSI